MGYLRITIFIVFIFNIWPLAAQTIAIPEKGIQQDGYVDHDFGQYRKGKKQLLVLSVQNTSEVPLQLEKLELSCDCLKAAQLPKLPIPAGASTRIKIQHDARHVGDYSVFAILHSSANNHPKLWIRLQGEVMPKKWKK